MFCWFDDENVYERAARKGFPLLIEFNYERAVVRILFQDLAVHDLLLNNDAVDDLPFCKQALSRHFSWSMLSCFTFLYHTTL